jgi:hypothetical protein
MLDYQLVASDFTPSAAHRQKLLPDKCLQNEMEENSQIVRTK